MPVRKPSAPMSASASTPLPVPAPTPSTDRAPAADTVARRRGRRLPPATGRTVRVTVDLPSRERRAVGTVADLMGDELGVHVPVGQVMAALAHLVAADDPAGKALRDSVSAHLRERVVE